MDARRLREADEGGVPADRGRAADRSGTRGCDLGPCALERGCEGVGERRALVGRLGEHGEGVGNRSVAQPAGSADERGESPQRAARAAGGHVRTLAQSPASEVAHEAEHGQPGSVGRPVDELPGERARGRPLTRRVHHRPGHGLGLGVVIVVEHGVRPGGPHAPVGDHREPRPRPGPPTASRRGGRARARRGRAARRPRGRRRHRAEGPRRPVRGGRARSGVRAGVGGHAADPSRRGRRIIRRAGHALRRPGHGSTRPAARAPRPSDQTASARPRISSASIPPASVPNARPRSSPRRAMQKASATAGGAPRSRRLA